MKSKLGFSDGRWNEVREVLVRVASELAPTAESVDPLTGEAADDRVLACAVEVNADVLVTGDRRHLLPVAEYRGVRLITPQALLAELQ